MDRHDLESSGTQRGQEAGSCEYRNEAFAFTIRRKFFDYIRNYQLLKQYSAPQLVIHSVTQSKPVVQGDLKSPIPK